MPSKSAGNYAMKENFDFLSVQTSAEQDKEGSVSARQAIPIL